MNMIHKFVETVLSARNNKSAILSLGKLTAQEVEMLRMATGFDLSGFERVLDKFGVIHAFVKHGNTNIEKNRGQVAVTIEVFDKIPAITSTPDLIKSGEQNSHGKELIKYYKDYEDVTIVYVEEKRDGKKMLATQTFYIRKNRKL